MGASLLDTGFATLDQGLEELSRMWKRTEAATAYAQHPPVARVGQTPKELVWSKNKARLYRYAPEAEVKHAVPLLLVYALINKPYILDLSPGNSFVEFLVERGYAVYMLDWGSPGPEDAELELADYVLDYMPRAVEAVLKHARAPQLSMLGYCIGGTLAAMYAATHADGPLKNLILLTTPVAFHDAGLYTAWLDPKHFDADRVVEALGLVPTQMLDLGAKWLKPMQNYLGPWVNLYERLDDPEYVAGWVAMNRWVNDGVPFAGAAYGQWVKDFYQGDKLIKGEVQLRGRRVDLGQIRCSVLNVYAELDHICPPHQSKPLLGLVASEDKEELQLKAGHVGVVAGRGARKSFFPKADAWLEARSQA